MGLFEKPIALEPGVGGRSIGISALQPADIIVSTTKATVSGVIRVGTQSTEELIRLALQGAIRE